MLEIIHAHQFGVVCAESLFVFREARIAIFLSDQFLLSKKKMTCSHVCVVTLPHEKNVLSLPDITFVLHLFLS